MRCCCCSSVISTRRSHACHAAFHPNTPPYPPFTNHPDQFETSNLRSRMQPIASRPATDDELLLTHSRELIDAVRETPAQLDGDDYKYFESPQFGDTYFNAKTSALAELAAGGLIELLDHMADGRVHNGVAVIRYAAFPALTKKLYRTRARAARKIPRRLEATTDNLCDNRCTSRFLDRPPGHHAECHKAMGFCVYNNVAVAINAARAKHPGEYKRVLIVDWDVHHVRSVVSYRCLTFFRLILPFFSYFLF